MIALTIAIVLIAGIGVLYGSFVALIATTLTFVIGYFSSLYLSIFLIIAVLGGYEYWKVYYK